MTNLLAVDGCAVYSWNAEAQTLSLSAAYPQPGWVRPNARAQAVVVPPLSLTARVLTERYAGQLNLGHPAVEAPEQAYMRSQGFTRLTDAAHGFSGSRAWLG